MQQVCLKPLNHKILVISFIKGQNINTQLGLVSLFLWGSSDHLWDIFIADAYWKCGQNDHKHGVVVLNLNSNLVKTIALNFPGWCGPISTAWAYYQIRNIAVCACAGNAGKVFSRRRFQRKPLVSDPGMHHGTCVTHVPWCMSGSLTFGDGENVPGIPRACAPAILRIWQEAHGEMGLLLGFPHTLFGCVWLTISACPDITYVLLNVTIKLDVKKHASLKLEWRL